MKASFLQISGLSVGFGLGNTLITDIELSAKKGDCIAILGRNGEGKTTFLRTLAGLQNPLSGKIEVDGKTIHQLNDKKRAELLSIVLTEKPNISGITVEEFIGFGRYPFTGWLGLQKKEDALIVSNSMETCGISHLSSKNLSHLSDGEKQKVMIARCLAQNTPLVLLDEPTVHLDVSNRVAVFELMRKVCLEKQLCMIYITHELSLAMRYSNKIWLLNDGKIDSFSPSDLSQHDSINKAFGISEW